MSNSFVDLQKLRARMAGISERLDGPWAAKLNEQRHLDRDTTESAYWHSGYHQALTDVLQLMSRPQAICDTSDNSSPCLRAG
jgi:hypothetical protein